MIVDFYTNICYTIIDKVGVTMDIYIDSNWNFNQIVFNLRALKSQYNGILCSFSYFQKHDIVEFKRNCRNKIYALPFEEWKKDRIWEYINGYESLQTLKNIVRKQV